MTTVAPEVATMKPGRELDALIAEKIMGWKWFSRALADHCRWLAPHAMLDDEYEVPADEGREPESDSWWLSDKPTHHKMIVVPHYSTDVTEALPIVEQMMPQFTCERLIGGCQVQFFDGVQPHEATVRDFGLSFAERLAWAICLVALKWADRQKDELVSG